MNSLPSLLLVLLLALPAYVSGQAPSIQWQKSFGGSSEETAHSIREVPGGGYIMIGYTFSADGDVTGYHDSADCWVVRISSTGTVLWKKCFGGSGIDLARSIVPTADGGYVFSAYTSSNDGTVSGNHGGTDYWVVKINDTGAIQWQKCLGGTLNDYGMGLDVYPDSTIVVGGYSKSNDGDVSGNHGDHDAWIVKLSSTGSIVWQHSIGGSDDDEAYYVHHTMDGGAVFCGISASNDGDVSGNKGNGDYWVVKLSSSGSIQWQRCLGGTQFDCAFHIRQTFDSGYIVSGYAESNDSDISGNHGGYDNWIVKLSSAGTIQWQKAIGGTLYEYNANTWQLPDSGYIVASHVNSNDGDVSGNHGAADLHLARLSPSGSVIWTKTLGGTAEEDMGSVFPTADGGFIISGSSKSADGDVTLNHGTWDYWIVKLSNPLSVMASNSFGRYMLLPNPATDEVRLVGDDCASCRLVTIDGKLVKELHNTNTVSLKDVAPGTYLIQVYDVQGQLVYTDRVLRQ